MSSCILILHNKDTQSIEVKSLKQFFNEHKYRKFPEEMGTEELTKFLIDKIGGGRLYLCNIPTVAPRIELITVQRLRTPIIFSYYPRGKAPKTDADITVDVLTVTGHTYINIPPEATIRELKCRIEREHGSQTESQRLLYKGKEQCFDDRTLDDCGIQQKSTVLLQKTYLLGGRMSVFNFVDVAKENIAVRKWSPTAPNWRRASHGLCLEGICQNAKCKAHQKKVIMNMGNNLCYDMSSGTEIDKCRCPICKKAVEPSTVSFNNCQFRFSGCRREEIHGCTEIVQKESDWFLAGDEYHSFQEGKTCDWISLQFWAIPFNKKKTRKEICCICRETLHSEANRVLTYCCKNPFHHTCLRKWTDAQPRCPTCNHALRKVDAKPQGDAQKEAMKEVENKEKVRA